MNATRYTAILEKGLLPLIRRKFRGQRNHFQQDNDPKHTSHHAQQFFKSKKINWWRTPAESPDLNPIELVCGSMKRYLCSHYKPKDLEDLKNGIRCFWRKLTPQVCKSYIAHIQKVMVKVIEVNSEPSGY